MGMYKVPIYYTCVFLLVFGTMVFIGRLRSKELKSDLLFEAIIRMIALQSLHTGLYHANIIMWRAAKIDYSDMFDFSAQEDLYRYPVWALVEYLACIATCFIFRLIEIKEEHQQHLVFLLPAIALSTFRTMIAYRTDIKRIISFPFRPVGTIDEFLGDQMCSQVPGLRKIQYIICFCAIGSFYKWDYKFYKTNTVYKVLSYVVSCFPFFCRGLQCFWRYNVNRSEKRHLINLGKYFCSLLEAAVRVAYENKKTSVVLYLLVVISLIATVYQLYWDFVKDWDLLQFNSENRWLRNELRLKRKYIYFLSMVLNLILRFGWILTLVLPTAKLDDEDITFIVAVVEVIRRVQWNFYRLENEEVKLRGARLP